MDSSEWQKFRKSVDSANEQEVYRMWDILKARLNFLRTCQVYQFRVRDRVQFRDKRGNLHVGTVTKLNRKTVGVLVNGREWRVGPNFLSLVVKESWQEVLGLRADAPYEHAKKAYRELAKTRHPDNGGSTVKMQKLNQAWAEAQAYYAK